MRASDAFRNELHAAIAALRAWAQGLADVADIAETEADDYWRLALRPHAATACPVELVVYADQRYDIAIGGEVWEDNTLGAASELLPLLAAISEGRVVTRTWETLATGAPFEVESIVETGERPWRAARTNPALARIVSREDCVARTRHYAPYRWRNAAA